MVVLRHTVEIQTIRILKQKKKNHTERPQWLTVTLKLKITLRLLKNDHHLKLHIWNFPREKHFAKTKRRWRTGVSFRVICPVNDVLTQISRPTSYQTGNIDHLHRSHPSPRHRYSKFTSNSRGRRFSMERRTPRTGDPGRLIFYYNPKDAASAGAAYMAKKRSWYREGRDNSQQNEARLSHYQSYRENQFVEARTQPRCCVWPLK